MSPSAARPAGPDRPRWLAARVPNLWADPWEVFVWALLLLFTLVNLGPALIGRGALIDSDLLGGFLPFRAGGVPEPDTIRCRGDTVDFVMPATSNFVEGIRHGEFRTWSPYTVGGAPLGSLPNQSLLSPLSWPIYVMPLWLAPAFIVLSELALVLAGMVAFLGRLGVRRAWALLAGLIFFSSGFMMMWTNWPHPKVAAFVPALFWALDRAVTSRRPRDVVFVGGAVAGMLLGGFPAVTLFALTLGGVYVLVRAVPIALARRWGSLVSAFVCSSAGVALGAALAGVHLLPFVANIDTVGLDRRDFAGEHAPTGWLLTALAPDVRGICADGVGHGASNPIETVAFIGVGALVLILCAFLIRLPRGAGRPARVLLGWLLVVVVLVVWVGGPFRSLLDHVPFYTDNPINRAASVFGFLAAAVAGLGIDRLARRAGVAESDRHGQTPKDADESRVPALSPSWGVAVGILLAVTVLLAAVLLGAFQEAAEDDFVPFLRERLIWPTVLLVVSAAGAAFAVLAPSRLRWSGIVIVILVVVGQSSLFVHQMLPRSPHRTFYPVTPTHAYLQKHLGNERYAAAGSNLMYPATSAFYRLRTPVGHEFTQPRWTELLETFAPGTQLTGTFSVFPGRVTPKMAAASRILDGLAVRYWIAPPEQVVGRPTANRAVDSGPVELSGNERATCTVPAGALRGVQFALIRLRPIPAGRIAVMHVRVVTAEGVRESRRALVAPLAPGPLRIGVDGEDIASSAQSLRVEVWFTGFARPTVLAGTEEGLDCRAVQPIADDGLRLANVSAGALVYERLHALDRIRWAGHSEVETDGPSRLSLLRAGLPSGTVLLESRADPPATDSAATVDVVEDAGGRIVADVDATGAGYLVVADAIKRNGWNATVDGRPTPIVQADHALAGVPVDTGRHRVVLTYTAPGLRSGVLVTGGAAVVSCILLLFPVLPRLRSRRRPQSRRRLGA